MHALVIDENKAQRELIAGVLQQASYRVDVAASRGAALQILERESPELVVMAWSAAAVDVIRRIRQCDDGRHTYILCMIDRPDAASIPAMFTAGADDFMRPPILKEELLARAAAPQRIGRWRGLGAAAALDLAANVDLRKLAAFRELGRFVAADLSELLGSLELTESWLVTGELRGASIPMSIASEEAELRVSIVVETSEVSELSMLLVGDDKPSAEVIADMLREVANTAGGAVKRAASAEGIVVTTGLPVSASSGPTRNEMTRCWTAKIAGANARIGIIGELHKRTNQRVPVNGLQEGMVLSHDLRNEAGALLMPTGTRLTSTTITRMMSMLGPRYVVDVTTPAA